MSSKTARRNRRESSQVGATISRLTGLPPPEGSRQDSARCSSPQGERNSPSSASRDDPGRSHTKAGPAPHAPFQPQPPQLPNRGLVPRPHAPAEAEAEACSPSPPTRPAAAGPPGHSGGSRGPAPRLGSLVAPLLSGPPVPCSPSAVPWPSHNPCSAFARATPRWPKASTRRGRARPLSGRSRGRAWGGAGHPLSAASPPVHPRR